MGELTRTEPSARRLITYLFSHTTNRIDVGLGAQLFRHVLALPLAYFEARRLDSPAIGVAHDQPRFAVVAASQFDHIAKIEHSGETGNCTAYQQRLFLPVPAQKCRGRQAAE